MTLFWSIITNKSFRLFIYLFGRIRPGLHCSLQELSLRQVGSQGLHCSLWTLLAAGRFSRSSLQPVDPPCGRRVLEVFVADCGVPPCGRQVLEVFIADCGVPPCGRQVLELWHAGCRPCRLWQSQRTCFIPPECMRSLLPYQGLNPHPLHCKTQILNHQSIREVPSFSFHVTIFTLKEVLSESRKFLYKLMYHYQRICFILLKSILVSLSGVHSFGICLMLGTPHSVSHTHTQNLFRVAE